MTITPSQSFLFALLITGVLGFRHGWGRSVITTAMILGTLLFLSNGGDTFLSNLLTGGVGGALSGSGGQATPSGSAYCSTAGFSHGLSELLFAGMTFLGYSVGYRHGPPPKTSNHRLAGIIPGVINGTAIAFYISHNVFPGTQLMVNTPGTLDTSAYLPEVFAFGLVGLLIVLFVSGQTSKGK